MERRKTSRRPAMCSPIRCSSSPRPTTTNCRPARRPSMPAIPTIRRRRPPAAGSTSAPGSTPRLPSTPTTATARHASTTGWTGRWTLSTWSRMPSTPLRRPWRRPSAREQNPPTRSASGRARTTSRLRCPATRGWPAAAPTTPSFRDRAQAARSCCRAPFSPRSAAWRSPAPAKRPSWSRVTPTTSRSPAA